MPPEFGFSEELPDLDMGRSRRQLPAAHSRVTDEASVVKYACITQKINVVVEYLMFFSFWEKHESVPILINHPDIIICYSITVFRLYVDEVRFLEFLKN